MAEDVELCLEVQVDPASKKILSHPEKCRSTLLDVTVVKPKELEAFGTQKTNILRADEVRKLITSMEKQRRKKQKFLDKLKFDDTIIQIRKHEDYYDSPRRSKRPLGRYRDPVASSSPIDDLERKDFIGIAESVEPLFCEIRRSLKNVETRITNMQDINLIISETTANETGSEEMYCKPKNRSPLTSSKGLRNPSVYRVETAPQNLKSVLFSENKQKLMDKCGKVEGKCLCENCGIVGLLTECQKHPLLADFSDSPAPSNHKYMDAKKKTRFNLLRNLESGSKSRNINEAYVSQLTDRVKMLEERLAMQEERVVPKDYFKKIITKMVTNFSPKLFKSKSDTSLHCGEKNTNKSTKIGKASSRNHSPKSDHCKSIDYLKSKNNVNKMKEDKSTLTDDAGDNDYAWKWGEEILKPGIDLKNKMVTLLNELLGKFSSHEGGSKEASVKSDTYNSETFRRFIKHNVNPKVYNAQVETKPKYASKEFEKPKKVYNFEPFHQTSVTSNYSKSIDTCRNRSEVPTEKYRKHVDISYVNPKLSLWRTESPDANKTQEVKNDALGRQEFLKIVAKAKQTQKDILWKNIWNQARANGQTKDDIITVKIPGQERDSKGKQNMFEAEITIGEVEEILKGT